MKEFRMTVDTLIDRPALGVAAAGAITELVERVQPSVVLVRHGRRGVGTGVIWRANGAVVTNHHVVAGGAALSVQLQDGRTVEAKVAASNPELDLALLELPARGLPAAPVGESERLRVGELVFAIGNPMGQRNVVTAGIVSAIGAIEVRGGRQATYIRSDVRLAPGNSGGPLLNAQGAVVGINAMIFGGDLAVSIPSQVASEWVAGLPSRPVTLGIGVQPAPLPAALQKGELVGRAAALLVVSLAPGGSAERAGLLVGDLILAADGAPMEAVAALQRILARHSLGRPLALSVLRGGTPLDVFVTLDG
jgi:serine protease Do